MSQFDMAVGTVGKDILFIKDNKIIGKGRSGSMMSYQWVSGDITEGPIVEMVKDLENVKKLGLRHAGFHFSPFDGTYLGTNFTDLEGDEVLDDVRIVDEFNFSFGICPKDFEEVEGYKSKIQEIKASINTFSARAECPYDVDRFELELRLYDKFAVMTRFDFPLRGEDGQPVHVGEVAFEVQTVLIMSEMLDIFDTIVDSHVMKQSLKQCPLKENDGSRDHSR